MLTRKKILIIERDDFLREIVGNLLHKKNFYIKNGSTIENGIQDTLGEEIDIVILGTSCDDYKEKSSVNYIRKSFEHVNVFILNNGEKPTGLVRAEMEMKISELSVQDLIEKISHI